MKHQLRRRLTVLAALLLAVSLLSGLTVQAAAAGTTDEMALRKAIAKNAYTYCATAAVQKDGTVMFDNYMEREQISGWTNVASISFPLEYDKPVALRWDGTVLTSPDHYWRDVVSQWRDIVAVYELWFGNGEVVGLRLDGTVVSTNPGGVYSTWTNVEILEQSEYSFSYVVGITKDGRVLCPGLDLSTWTDVVQVDSYSDKIVGLRKDGTVLYADETGSKVMEGWTDVVAVECHEDILALRKDGTVLTTADPKYAAELSGWKDITAIANAWYQYAGLKADGTVIVAGDFGADGAQPDASQWKNMVDIRITGSSLLGVRADGAVLEWNFGRNQTRFTNVRAATGAYSPATPGSADLLPFGDKIAYPQENSYLDAYETKQVNAPNGGYINTFWKSEGADCRRSFYLYQGDKVTVLAREGIRSCVIFTDTNGDQQVGWTTTDYLKDVEPEPVSTVPTGTGPSKEDLVPFGNKIAYPKEESYLKAYETKYVKAPNGGYINTFWKSSGADCRRPFYLYQGDAVTVLAREGIRSCVIFTDTTGSKQVGWTTTGYLSDIKP